MERGRWKYLAGGSAVGALNGLFGGGGGTVAVPLLERMGLGTQEAHATAIAVILPISLVSGLIYFFNGLAPLSVLIPVSLGVAAGGFLGARLLGVLPVRAVDLLFGALMLAAGVRMLF